MLIIFIDETLTISIQVRMDLGIMVMKVYFTVLRAPELEPHNQMLFSFMLRTPPFFLEGFYSSLGGYSQCILSSADMAISYLRFSTNPTGCVPQNTVKFLNVRLLDKIFQNFYISELIRPPPTKLQNLSLTTRCIFVTYPGHLWDGRGLILLQILQLVYSRAYWHGRII